MTDDPYASPEAGPDAAMDAVDEMPIATQGKRFINLIVDNIIIQVLSTVAGFMVGLIYAATQMAATGTPPTGTEAGLQIAGFVAGLLVFLLYYVFFEALFQRTPAKFLTGTTVVNEVGEQPTFGQVLGRSFARFIPFEAFSYLVGKQPVGWHDSLSGTRVVSKG